jgi:hypothetical protein
MREIYKNVATGVGVVAFGALAVLGFRGNKDVRFTDAEQQRAYSDKVAGMTVEDRFYVEFISGANLCNPNDQDSLFSMMGVPFATWPGPEFSCGANSNEDDERVGSECLASTPYDPRTTFDRTNAGLQPVPGEDDQLVVHPDTAGLPDLELMFTPEGAVAMNVATKQVIDGYDTCPGIELVVLR